MKKIIVLRVYWTSVLLLLLLNFYNPFYSYGQAIDFNHRIFTENRSTILRNIMMAGDSLLISGEIGRDSLGLSGFFVFRTDTFGKIGLIKFFRDSSLMDHALLDGRNPILINHNDNIVLGGVFLQRDDLFAMELGSDLSIIMYKEYLANYVTMYIHDVEELYSSYYFLGYIQTQNGDHDVFLQKIDSSGNKIWEKTYGIPSKDETGRAVIIEDDGLTIMVSESLDNTPTIKNDTRYWIRFMHVDTSGAIFRDWREEVTGEEGWSGTLLKYQDDYIYSTNIIGEETNFGPLVASQVVRRDQDFNLTWRKPFGDPNNHHNQIGDMIFSTDSTVILTSGNIWDTTLNLSWAQVMMIDLCGNELCEVRDTGIFFPTLGSSNRLEGIVQSEGGSIYAVGYTYKSAGFYEGLLLKITVDGCIDTICTTTDIENLIRLNEDQVLIYPNPVRSDLQIKLSDEVSLPVMVRLFDVYGRPHLSTRISQKELSLDISGVPNGLYHLVVEKNGLIFSAETVFKME